VLTPWSGVGRSPGHGSLVFVYTQCFGSCVSMKVLVVSFTAGLKLLFKEREESELWGLI